MLNTNIIEIKKMLNQFKADIQFKDDIEIINDLIDNIDNICVDLSKDKLELIRTKVEMLTDKYSDFSEVENLYIQVQIELEQRLHRDYVNQLRENNKKNKMKREKLRL